MNNKSNNFHSAPETFIAAFSAEAEVHVPETEAFKLADAANLPTAKATTETLTKQQLLQEIERLWAANKVNRYELGEKLSLLKTEAKHGEWMSNVEKMGIPHRTVTSLISYYREEFQKTNSEPIADLELDPEETPEAQEPPAKTTPKGSSFRPRIILKWGPEETDWKRGVELIIADCDVENDTEAALFAVRILADFLQRKRNGETNATFGLPSLTENVESLTEPDGPAVTVEPAPTRVIEAVPMEVADVPVSVTIEDFSDHDLNEEVL